LGTLYHITGDYDRAGRCYCKAISLEPTKYEAHYNLAVLLKRLGHYNEAYEEIDKAVTLITALDQNSALLEYIASVMNDISRNVYNNEEYKRYVKYRETLIAQKKAKEIKKEKEKKTKKSKKMHRDYGEPISEGPIFIDKKEVTEEELDEAIHSDFGSCPSYHYFDPSRDDI
jgi:tetratricopeptide (TPR) repeat protein